MSLLATSTPGRRNPVRILFYGQSITKQEWSQQVAQDIRTRFPYADLTIENRAIGGYSSEYLVRTVGHDVFGFYPDLIVFHDYGGEENYEKIIAAIEKHTTAEILIQSDYPTWTPVEGQPNDPAKAKSEEWHDRHCYEWLPELCRRYGCGLLDVRRPWIQYLKENHLRATDVLSDGTHLNAQGNWLLAELTKRYLRYDSSLPAERPGGSGAGLCRRGRCSLGRRAHPAGVRRQSNRRSSPAPAERIMPTRPTCGSTGRSRRNSRSCISSRVPRTPSPSIGRR